MHIKLLYEVFNWKVLQFCLFLLIFFSKCIISKKQCLIYLKRYFCIFILNFIFFITIIISISIIIIILLLIIKLLLFEFKPTTDLRSLRNIFMNQPLCYNHFWFVYCIGVFQLAELVEKLRNFSNETNFTAKTVISFFFFTVFFICWFYLFIIYLLTI